MIHAFKEYCAILFFKGVLLNDPNGLLSRQTENVQSARQIRFAGIEEIAELAPVLETYIHEAAEAERAGLKVEFKKTAEFTVPEEFQIRLDEISALKDAFEALTPGRQRTYILHFSQPKQSRTREARIEKWMPQILNGKGLNDR